LAGSRPLRAAVPDAGGPHMLPAFDATQLLLVTVAPVPGSKWAASPVACLPDDIWPNWAVPRAGTLVIPYQRKRSPFWNHPPCQPAKVVENQVPSAL